MQANRCNRPHQRSDSFTFCVIVGALVIAYLVVNIDHNTDAQDKVSLSCYRTASPNAQQFIQNQSADTFNPVLYNLKIAYEARGSPHYNGTLLLEIHILQRISEIKLNVSYNIDIIENVFVEDRVTSRPGVFTYRFGNDITRFVRKGNFSKTNTLLTITRDNPPYFEIAQHYVVIIEFKSNVLINVGYCRNKFVENNKGSHYIDVTNFRPNYAHYAFPCFDVPRFKSKFKLQLETKDPVMTALSNMEPEEIVTEADGNRIYIFPTSLVKMSTHQMSFVVGEFTFKEYHFRSQGVMFPLRIYARESKINNVEWAGEFARKIIQFYIEYFNMPYPHNKLDIVAMPNYEFRMETGSLGLILLKDTNVFYNEKKYTDADKQRVALSISREIINSWFENKVDMTAWKNLWFTEAMATFMMYEGMINVDKNFDWEQHYLTHIIYPLLDWGISPDDNRPILQYEDTTQIEDRFNIMQSKKATAVLRMVHFYIYPDRFQKAMRNFMEHYDDGEAQPEDFFQEIGKVTFSLLEMIYTFMNQTGYPILYLRRYRPGYLRWQQKFTIFPDDNPGQKFLLERSTRKMKLLAQQTKGDIWVIPIEPMNRKFSMIQSRFGKIKFPSSPFRRMDYTSINSIQTGYFRVNYDNAGWNYLIENYQNKNSNERAHLIENAFSLAKAGHLNYSIPLRLTKQLGNETSFLPITVLRRAIDDMLFFLRDSPQEINFKRHMIRIIYKAYENSIYPTTDRFTRVQIVELACELGLDFCLDSAADKLELLISLGEPLSFSADDRDFMYKYGSQKSSELAWNLLMNLSRDGDTKERVDIVVALANSHNPQLLKELLETFHNRKYEHYITAVKSMSKHYIGSCVLWDFIRKKWLTVKEPTSEDEEIIRSVAKTFTTETKYRELEQIFKKNQTVGGESASRNSILKMVADNIKFKKLWDSRCKPDVEQWLAYEFIFYDWN